MLLLSGGVLALSHVTVTPLNGTATGHAPVGMITNMSEFHFDTTPCLMWTIPILSTNPPRTQSCKALNRTRLNFSTLLVSAKNMSDFEIHNSLKCKCLICRCCINRGQHYLHYRVSHHLDLVHYFV